MSSENNYLDVNIHGREYRVACPPGERSALESAVGFVDQRMSEIAGKTKNATAERVAVMAALNIAHEFLSYRDSNQEGFDTASAKRRIGAMEAQLDALLIEAESAEER